MLYRRRKRRRTEVRDSPGPTATMWLTKRFVAAFSDLKVTRSPRQVRHELSSAMPLWRASLNDISGPTLQTTSKLVGRCLRFLPAISTPDRD
jgi:hypothetical protein